MSHQARLPRSSLVPHRCLGKARLDPPSRSTLSGCREAPALPLEEWWLRNNIEARDSAGNSSAGPLRVLQKGTVPIFSSARSCTLKISMQILDSRGTANRTTTSECRTSVCDCVSAAATQKNKWLPPGQLDQDRKIRTVLARSHTAIRSRCMLALYGRRRGRDTQCLAPPAKDYTGSRCSGNSAALSFGAIRRRSRS